MSKSSRRYMCTCQIHHKSSGGRKAVEHRHLKFHPTEVDEDEICIHCGHYAWEEPQHVIYPRTSTIPWRSEVQGKNTPNAWNFNTEVRDAYFEKTYYSDYELDLGDAFDASGINQRSGFEEICDVYVRWGGNNHE